MTNVVRIIENSDNWIKFSSAKTPLSYYNSENLRTFKIGET
jgi:hypothetical protein